MKNLYFTTLLSLIMIPTNAFAQKNLSVNDINNKKAERYIFLAYQSSPTNSLKAVQYSDIALKLATSSKSYWLLAKAYLLQLDIKAGYLTYTQDIEIASLAYENAIRSGDSILVFKACSQLVLQKVYANDYNNMEALTNRLKNYYDDSLHHTDSIRAKAAFVLGQANYMNMFTRPDALNYYKKGLALASNINDKQMAAACKVAVFHTAVFLMMSDSIATRLLFEAMDYYSSVGNYIELMNAYTYLADSYRLIGNITKAIENYNHALEIDAKHNVNSYAKIGNIHFNIVQAYFVKRDFESGKPHLLLAEQAFSKADFKYGLSLVHCFWGQYYMAMNDSETALKSFDKADSLNKLNKSAGLTMSINVYKGMLLEKIGKAKEADTLLSKAMDEMNTKIPKDFQKRMFERQKAFQGSADNDKRGQSIEKNLVLDTAFRHRHFSNGNSYNGKEEIRALDSLNIATGHNIRSDETFSTRFNQQVVEQEAKFRNKQISDSLREKDMEAQAAHRETLYKNYLILAVSVVCAMLVAFIYVLNRRKRKSILDKQKEMLHTANNLINNIHLFSTLNYDDPNKSNMLQVYIENISSFMQTMYNGKNPEKVNPSDVLEKICNNLEQILNKENKVTITLKANPSLLPIGMMENIAGLVSELVINCYKHAFKNMDNGYITVSLDNLDSKTYELVISDNGKGINIDFKENYGQTVITGLVYALRGTYNYLVDNGTVFTCRFPVPKQGR